jgi:hypothetical protein
MRQLQFFQEIVKQVNFSYKNDVFIVDKSFNVLFLERRMIYPLGTGVSNFPYPINESSETDGDDDHSSPTRQTAINRITTTDLVFDQPRSNSQRYPHPQLPRVIVRQSSIEENDNNNTATTMYESLRDSPTASFTTPRAANFFVGSLGGTTDNTNLSTRSVIEDLSDIERDDNDERMHSVLTDVEINLAYVPDEEEESIDVLRTNL